MIKIFCISDADKHFETPIQEYVKRMSQIIQIINIKPNKKDNPKEIIQGDTDEIAKRLKGEKTKGAFVVLLSKDGKSWTTEQWKELMLLKQNESQDVIFVIGGPYGLDEEKLKSRIDLSLSFGAITMPHGLVKLVVLEQIYRCLQMIGGKSYHY